MNIHPLLDRELQEKAQRYEFEKHLFSVSGSMVSFALLLIFWLFWASPLQRALRHEDPVLQIILFVLCMFALLWPAGTLFSWIGGFLHEKAYGFSTRSFTDWFLEHLKGSLLNALFSIVVGGLLIVLWTLYPELWFLYAALAMSFLSVIIIAVYPIWIAPIFNKYEQIEDAELVSRLREILVDMGMPEVEGFYMQDMSRQTTKENAFLAGIGRTKRVVLSDNIIWNMDADELETVIAHEVGHHRYHHIWKNVILMSAVQFSIFTLLHYLIPLLSPAFLSNRVHNMLDLPLFLMLYSLLSLLLLSPLASAVSRHFERQADRTSLEATGKTDAFIRAMAGLANRNLSNAYPAKWMKWLYYSHPPVGERLAFAESWRSGMDSDLLKRGRGQVVNQN